MYAMELITLKQEISQLKKTIMMAIEQIPGKTEFKKFFKVSTQL